MVLTLAAGLSDRERDMLIQAVRLAEAIRLGLNPADFDPAAAMPSGAREAARRAETQLRCRPLEQMGGQPLALAAASGTLLLSRTQAFPSRLTEAFRQAVDKVFGQLHLERLSA
ncbi:hypothetical protein [Deinococcus multiflagellatus]|uniref:hypothetical protein n=1 Tax=Deinococcus multiflagellatus TaxID=1656887 RepID=UPI001CC9C690|nr:hypothetical protein [Deinococcus multiflagellatus]MBZ9715767.1 hypothetical protein [Deinococcus multiflagellatus]